MIFPCQVRRQSTNIRREMDFYRKRLCDTCFRAEKSAFPAAWASHGAAACVAARVRLRPEGLSVPGRATDTYATGWAGTRATPLTPHTPIYILIIGSGVSSHQHRPCHMSCCLFRHVQIIRVFVRSVGSMSINSKCEKEQQLEELNDEYMSFICNKINYIWIQEYP